MWRSILLVLIALLCGASLFAQSTTVSGQITDAGSQSWNSGTYSFVFTPNPLYPTGPYTWSGGTLNTTISGSLTATGSYSVSIPSNSAITPVNSSWTITFCPQASASCFTTAVSITGATQTVNATPPTILINLQTAIPPIRAYSTSEVTGAIIGSQFYLLGTGPQVCNAVSGNNCTTWVNVGSGGVGSGAGPVMAYYLSPQCPIGNTGQCFFTPANTRVDNTCTWSNASTTVTCTDSPFTSTAVDVGKQAMGWSTCATDLPIANYANAITSGTTAITISSFTDANHVVLSGTPAGTQSTTPSCFIFGNTDDVGFASLNTVLAVQTTFCPKVFLAAAQYFVTKPFFPASQPPGCATLPSLFGNPIYGNLDLPAGYGMEGRGSGETTLHIGNNFPNGASKTTYNSIASWLAIPPLGELRDVQITGDGQAGTCAGTTGGDILMYGAVAKWQDVTLTNFCSIPGNTTGNFYLGLGIYSDLLGQFNKLNMSAFGAKCLQIQGAGATSNGVQVALENCGTVNLDVQAQETSRWSFSCRNCYLTGSMTYNFSQQGNNFGVLNVAGGATVRLQDSYFFNCPAVNCNTQAGFPLLINMAGANSKVYLDGVSQGIVNSGTNTNPIGIKCDVGHNCTINARNTNFTAGTQLFNTADTLIDECGNTFGGGFGLGPGARPTILTCTSNGAITTVSTNFGSNLPAQTVLASAQLPVTLEARISVRQVTLGVGCSAASNTISGTLSWTTGGLAQTATINTLTINGNGAVGTSVFQNQTIRVDVGTAVTFTTTSTLASTGCTTTPQYAVDATL